MKKIFLAIFVTMFIQSSVYAEVIYSTRDSAAVINQLVSGMSDQLTQNKNFGDIQASAIAITSFVCLEDFKATSRLSNILSESFIHEMQVRGYKVVDFKTMSNIKIDSQGDFLFSRDISKLQTSLNVNYALTGTYTEYDSGVVINARIIDLKTHIILSTAQILIPKRIVNRISSVGNVSVEFMPNKISLTK